jgi:tetratricopeptide (TPR) repeat protein
VATEADRLFKRGIHLQARESWTAAVELFQKNISEGNPHLPSLYQAARTRILGELDQMTAIKLLDRYIGVADESTRPSIAAAWWRKGVAYEQLGELAEAISCYEKSLELDRGLEFASQALERLRARS